MLNGLDQEEEKMRDCRRPAHSDSIRFMHVPLLISCDVSKKNVSVLARHPHLSICFPHQVKGYQNRSTASKPWIKVSRSDPFNPLRLWGGGRIIQVHGMLGTGGMQVRPHPRQLAVETRTSERAKCICCAYFARNRPRISPVGQLSRTDSSLFRNRPYPSLSSILQGPGSYGHLDHAASHRSALHIGPQEPLVPASEST